MKHALKTAIKNIVGPENIFWVRSNRNYLLWLLRGKPVPAEGIYKWKILKKYAKKHGLRNFVETGTAGGGTVRKLERHFEALYTIELDHTLYEEGKRRSSNSAKITFLEGDSGIVLRSLLDKLADPALFWLDAHYSGTGTAKAALETPIVQELQSIFSHSVKKHVIVIDDMREFNGTHDYPILSEMKDFIMTNAPEYRFVLDNDLMIIMPRD